MFVGLAKVVLVLGQSHSLKEKRMVLRRIKDRVRERLGVVVNEVGDHDVWQRAELGVAVASGDRRHALEVIDSVVRAIAACGGGDVVAVAKDAVAYGDEPVPVTMIADGAIDEDRAGSGDKALAGDDWIPDAWREES